MRDWVEIVLDANILTGVGDCDSGCGKFGVGGWGRGRGRGFINR